MASTSAAAARATTLLNYERAIQASFDLATASRTDVVSQQVKQDAAAFLESLRANADGWRYSLELSNCTEAFAGRRS